MELDNGKPKDQPTEDVIFYVYDKDYKPSKEQLDKYENRNGKVTLQLLKDSGAYFNGEDGYDKAMNIRNKYRKEKLNG